MNKQELLTQIDDTRKEANGLPVVMSIFFADDDVRVTSNIDDWRIKIKYNYDDELRPLSGHPSGCIVDAIIGIDDGTLDFGQALDALKDGHRVARKGWNGKDQFVYYVEPNKYKAVTVAAQNMADEHGMVHYNGYFALKTVSGSISTWVPSITDCLAVDWYDLDAEQ